MAHTSLKNIFHIKTTFKNYEERKYTHKHVTKNTKFSA